MPKKTKREKIIADYRKRLKLLQENKVVIPIESADYSQTTDYFKKDFGKSLILITAVIALEISLYFARIIK